jgi:hypothetical protein
MNGGRTDYDQRIDDSMTRMQLPDRMRQAIRSVVAQYKIVNSEIVKDIFVCNELGEIQETDTPVVWLFTNNVANELRGLGSNRKISLLNHNDVACIDLEAKNFDWLAASSDSSLDLSVTYHFNRSYLLRARSSNCLTLMTVFRKYFARHLTPGDASGQKSPR